MDRSEWLADRRFAVQRFYDAEGATYDEGYDPVTPTHRHFVVRLAEGCPPGGVVLDAPCGTGPYVGIVRDAGRDVVGIDQSAGMLDRARAKHPDVRFERIGLQELAFDAEFDAVMCVDAMENVPPEDWPLVLGNLRRAVRPGSTIYLTIEEIDRRELEPAIREAATAGWPAVHGEMVSGDTAGYHYYPDREQVAGWLADSGLEVVDEADEWLDGYGYHHLLVRRASG